MTVHRKRKCLTLQDITTDAVARNLDGYASLGVIPLDVAAKLLQRVLQLGVLTPHSSALLAETGHEEIVRFLRQCKSLPPILPTRCGN
mmetsp:Transcript_5440/g.16488  ORF Transcript_5440/g.16488 Transcript_5440/m.16488 type:complete len:88 (+) Transcript_5440:107-370(+)